MALLRRVASNGQLRPQSASHASNLLAFVTSELRYFRLSREACLLACLLQYCVFLFAEDYHALKGRSFQ